MPYEAEESRSGGGGRGNIDGGSYMDGLPLDGAGYTKERHVIA
jgi:hypothetical protein